MDVLPAAQAEVAAIAVPALLEVQEAVQQAIEVPGAPDTPPTAADRHAAALIVAFEVTSPAHYTARLQRPVWPGGASGPTWGIGYDGGHQSQTRIRVDWRVHPQLDRLQSTSRVTGAPAQALVRTMQDVVTAYPLAEHVFLEASLPDYTAAARRTLGPGFDALPATSQAALVDLGYNRGWAMAGERRREMRALRDVCVPAADSACVAREIRSMTRLWRGTANGAGLIRRREAEARLAESN